MKVIDPGHLYEVGYLDDESGLPHDRVRFVKRIGPKFPGNEPPGYAGTIIQEVLRVCIDRLQYVNAQDPHQSNDMAMWDIRQALIALEIRAAERRGDESMVPEIRVMDYPETEPTCAGCGHIRCTRSHEA